jgi:hypothetical protein
MVLLLMYGQLVVFFVNFIRVYREYLLIESLFIQYLLLFSIWPGKSDVDQLYLIRKTLGNLIDKHITILKSNPHYKNVHIPEPDIIEPLEQKFPYVSERSLDFMKVCIEFFCVKIYWFFFRVV